MVADLVAAQVKGYQGAGVASCAKHFPGHGDTGVDTKDVTVTAPPANQAPTASFTHTETNLATSVNGSGSSDPDGTIASSRW